MVERARSSPGKEWTRGKGKGEYSPQEEKPRQWPKKATQPMMVRNFPWFGLVGKRKRRRLFPHVRVAKEEELRKNFPEKARKKEGNKLGA